jgi:myo-inositol-1(or 4)-monophosphatase
MASGWGDVTAALVYQPITDESFWAEKARGAWLQDARLRVSARRHLDESLIATGIPFRRPRAIAPNGRDLRGAWRRRSRASAASAPRRSISPGLRPAAMMGSGKAILKPWDTAAGCLLVREAGGFVTDWRGRFRSRSATPQVLAGNDALHSKLHKSIAGALKAS